MLWRERKSPVNIRLSPAFGAVVGRVGAAVRKVTHYSFPTRSSHLRFPLKSMSGKIWPKIPCVSGLFLSARLSDSSLIPVWMEQRTADLNLTGANGWLEEG